MGPKIDVMESKWKNSNFWVHLNEAQTKLGWQPRGEEEAAFARITSFLPTQSSPEFRKTPATHARMIDGPGGWQMGCRSTL